MPGRVVFFSMVPQAVHGMDGMLRLAGYEPVAVIVPRPRRDVSAEARERFRAVVEGAPEHLDVCAAHDRSSLERLVRAYEPELGFCAGYRWRIPPEVLSLVPLGVVNSHPSVLPRHRGPYPFAWAVREGDTELGLTLHLMDEDFDTGPILAQGARPMPEEVGIEAIAPVLGELSADLLPRALARLQAGDRGDPQTGEGATYAGAFGDDYATVDWSQPAASIHRQVAAWRHMPEPGIVADVDGERLRLLRTSLVDPGGDARQVEAGDGPLWIVESSIP